MDIMHVILGLGMFVFMGLFFAHKIYTQMLVGTIVGKYKGDKYSGGYIVVEAEKDATDENGHRIKRKVQQTYEVPSEYYNEKNIGDKGIFPF